MSSVSRQRISFTAPGAVEVREEQLEEPGPREVLVRTTYSAVSPGTERLLYQGAFPENVPIDSSIEALRDQSSSYPVSYGYSCVGEVEKIGADVPSAWKGTRVFAFHPHVSRFVASPASLVPIPPEVEETDAVLIPSVETAVNLVMDGRPMIGEKVVVYGQGVVGLLTTALLARHPLEKIVTVEAFDQRRRWSHEMGADQSFGAEESNLVLNSLDVETGDAREAGETYEGADLVYELTGTPSVLDEALRCAGFSARVVVGSWYGSKRADIDLGGRFHRSRMRVISSQVSTIDPAYRGRWTKDRRMETVISLLDDLAPSKLITERFSPEQAPTVYEQLTKDSSLLQPIFEYE